MNKYGKIQISLYSDELCIKIQMFITFSKYHFRKTYILINFIF